MRRLGARRCRWTIHSPGSVHSRPRTTATRQPLSTMRSYRPHHSKFALPLGDAMSNDEFDTTIDEAWRRYRIDLADRLHSISAISGFSIVADRALTASQVRIRVQQTDAHRVRLSVHPADLFADGGRFPRQLETMGSLGWCQMADGTLVIENDRGHVDELAALAVLTLREAGDVLHPSMLADAESGGTCPAEIHLGVGVRTRSSAHLRGLVLSALETMAGLPLDVDETGDLLVHTRPRPTHLSVHDDAPRIELWSVLTTGTPGRQVSTSVLAWHRPSNPFVSLVPRGPAICARLLLESTVFHPENLGSALGNWYEFLHDDAERLITEIAAPAPPSASRHTGRGNSAAA